MYTTAQWQLATSGILGFDDASPGYHVSPGVGELHIGDTGDNLWEERPVGGVLGLLEHLGVAITERGLEMGGGYNCLSISSERKVVKK